MPPTSHHPITQWLDFNQKFGLLQVPPDKALRLSIHELSHAMSISMPLWGLAPSVISKAIVELPVTQRWEHELLARAVEHQVLNHLGLQTDVTLQWRASQSVRIVKSYNEDERRDGPKMEVMGEPEALLLCQTLMDSQQCRDQVSRILALNTFLG